jgi:hypothetical protein
MGIIIVEEKERKETHFYLLELCTVVFMEGIIWVSRTCFKIICRIKR